MYFVVIELLVVLLLPFFAIVIYLVSIVQYEPRSKCPLLTNGANGRILFYYKLVYLYFY